MRRAIELAKRNPDAPFGCVISDSGGETVAEAVNDADRSPVLHGETAAIISLFEEDPGADTSGLTLYATAEPCPMCMAAVLWAGIGRVVYGTSIPTLKRLGWRQLDLRAAEVVERAAGWPPVELVGGVLEAECDRLFAPGPGRG